MHDSLFQGQAALLTRTYKLRGTHTVGHGKFNSCMDGHEANAKVKADVMLAHQYVSRKYAELLINAAFSRNTITCGTHQDSERGIGQGQSAPAARVTPQMH